MCNNNNKIGKINAPLLYHCCFPVSGRKPIYFLILRRAAFIAPVLLQQHTASRNYVSVITFALQLHSSASGGLLYPFHAAPIINNARKSHINSSLQRDDWNCRLNTHLDGAGCHSAICIMPGTTNQHTTRCVAVSASNSHTQPSLASTRSTYVGLGRNTSTDTPRMNTCKLQPQYVQIVQM